MIFYGWNHVVQKVMGKFQGNQCSLCEQSITYQLIRLRTYITIFFMPIICYKTEYVARCSCGYKKQLTKQEANDILDLQLPRSKKMMQIGNVLKFTAALLVVGFIALVIIAPEDESVNSGSENILSIDEIKKMVKDDGEYTVYDEQGRVVADLVVKDGTKRALYYYEYYPFTEGITNGHDYTEVYYYYERDKNEMSFVEDTAMVICDENFVGLRYHWYEAYDDELFWGLGVDDFNAIKYCDDRIIYPIEQYINEDETEYYSKIRVEKGNDHAVMTFYNGTNNKDQNLITLVDIGKKNPTVHSEERLRYFVQMELAPDSTVDEILDYIEKNDIQYDTRDYKVYYEGINDVMTHRVYEWVDNGNKRSEESDYEVTQQDNGYYIAKLVE